jgi:hypothetical protein
MSTMWNKRRGGDTWQLFRRRNLIRYGGLRTCYDIDLPNRLCHSPWTHKWQGNSSRILITEMGKSLSWNLPLICGIPELYFNLFTQPKTFYWKLLSIEWIHSSFCLQFGPRTWIHNLGNVCYTQTILLMLPLSGQESYLEYKCHPWLFFF